MVSTDCSLAPNRRLKSQHIAGLTGGIDRPKPRLVFPTRHDYGVYRNFNGVRHRRQRTFNQRTRRKFSRG